jgi:hypothetical protein
MLKEHLETFTRQFELAPYIKERTSFFVLEIDPDTKLLFEELEVGFSMSAKIAPLPSDKKEDLLMILMNANFIGQGTGGSTISLDSEEKFLTLSAIFTYDMNYKTFTELIEDFVNYLDYWKAEIIRYQKQNEQSIFS